MLKKSYFLSGKLIISFFTISLLCINVSMGIWVDLVYASRTQKISSNEINSNNEPALIYFDDQTQQDHEVYEKSFHHATYPANETTNANASSNSDQSINSFSNEKATTEINNNFIFPPSFHSFKNLSDFINRNSNLSLTPNKHSTFTDSQLNQDIILNNANTFMFKITELVQGQSMSSSLSKKLIVFIYDFFNQLNTNTIISNEIETDERYMLYITCYIFAMELHDLINQLEYTNYMISNDSNSHTLLHQIALLWAYKSDVSSLNLLQNHSTSKKIYTDILLLKQFLILSLN